MQDSQKILIFENEAIQRDWAVLLIISKRYSSAPPCTSVSKQSAEIAGAASKRVNRIVAR
jgi:hypothetical protein